LPTLLVTSLSVSVSTLGEILRNLEKSYSDKYTTQMLKELYHLQQGFLTGVLRLIGVLKERLKIDNFTGIPVVIATFAGFFCSFVYDLLRIYTDTNC
jgi:hypothetical protein